MTVDMNFMVGGEAGQGVQSVGFLLAKVFARGGFNVFADQDYESRIRGGHNFFRIRVKDSSVQAIAEAIDMLVALNDETIYLHRKELADKSVIIFDTEKTKPVESNGNIFGVPLRKLAEEKGGNKLMTNTVALGAALGLVKYDSEIINEVLREYFGAETGEGNIRAARAGYEYARENFKGEFNHLLNPVTNVQRMLLTGNDALALGAVAAGCNFVAAYPMTPSTSIMEYLAGKAKQLDLVVVQPEDEIAAINMIIGAAFAGARAMTTTSGSGFCLMVEGLGLAGITETPIVVVDGQRPGPAVGLPTRTEQGDLQFVLNAHHGEFPRAVIAPATIEETFWLTVKSFNLAEKYQLPVIILTDHYLVSSYATVDRFDISKVTIDRGLLYSNEEAGQAEYKRHQITESGISPRAFPGLGEALVVTDSDEHDEAGHIIEDANMRTMMMDKRLRKLSGLKSEANPPQVYGPSTAETTLIGWGSTYGAIQEAVDILGKEGASINSLHLSELSPFPSEAVSDVLSRAHNTYVIENNASGQLARLIREHTGIKVKGTILKYDGRPFTPAYIVRTLRKEA
ncbi:MAG: 2-oxoacid:acceptor oxidoreductase subunit alpha [Dehalococcoidales bacterium]|nr:2-oxoacid:acceptor oxidoreductase subunit alpha [Dehalococcoidales bacterium]